MVGLKVRAEVRVTQACIELLLEAGTRMHLAPQEILIRDLLYGAQVWAHVDEWVGRSVGMQ